MRKVASIFSVAALFFAASSIAQTASLKGDYAACVSDSLFDEFITAAVKKDELAMNHLLSNGCIITKKGIQVSVLDRTWSGTTKVRAYVGNDSVVLWTNSENIQR